MKIGHWILKNGKVKKVDLYTWAEWFQNSPDRIVAKTNVKGVGISTIFMGLDHNFDSKGKPILFETMIFNSHLDVLKQFQERYTSLEDAKKGHKKAVNFVRRTLNKLNSI